MFASLRQVVSGIGTYENPSDWLVCGTVHQPVNRSVAGEQERSEQETGDPWMDTRL